MSLADKILTNKPRGYGPGSVILQDKKVVFCIIPKCGNQSIKTMLAEKMGYGGPKKSRKALHHIRLKDVPDDYLIISTIRNPFDRAVSIYTDKVRDRIGRPLLKRAGFKASMSFEQFCSLLLDQSDYDDEVDGHLKSQMYYLTKSEGSDKIVPDVLVRLEQRGLDWAWAQRIFMKHTGTQLADLPHLHKGKREEMIAYYNKETRRLVAERYAQDFKYLGYNPKMV